MHAEVRVVEGEGGSEGILESLVEGGDEGVSMLSHWMMGSCVGIIIFGEMGVGEVGGSNRDRMGW